MDINELQNNAIETATEHIRAQRKVNHSNKVKIVCLTVVVCVIIVCTSILGGYSIYQQQQTIRDQQWALNSQYAQIMDYLRGVQVVVEETTTHESQADGDGSIAVSGDGNITTEGDING